MDDHALAEVFGEIARREAEIEEQLAHLVAIPSVAGDRDGTNAAAAATAELCREAGFDTELVDGSGAPAVFAEVPAAAGSPTVLFYGHYDVQPADPLDAWTTPPFEPTVRDGALYGRGAGDDKGQYLAHIAAVAALSTTCGCPVGVKLLIEGEEEIGSPGLPALVSDNAARLACDVAVTADGPYHPDGRPLIIFGVRGLLYLDVELEGAGRDLHSGSNGGIAPAPAIDLVRALSALWAADGSIAVPGFSADVTPPTGTEAELGRALSDRWRALMFAPNINLAGISAGYAGDGVKTVIPNRAHAKIDVRLVADQDPEDIFERLERFLAGHGARVTRRAAVPPSRTPVDTPWVAPVRRAIASAWGAEPLLQPCLGGTTPDHVFTRLLGVPSLIVPYAPADMCHHAPNEHLALDALHRGVRTSAALCMELGRGGQRPTHSDSTSGAA